MKIKADETLFRKWNSLRDKIIECGTDIGKCRSIVQKDMVIDRSQLDEWKIRVMDLQCYLLNLKHSTEILMHETLNYVKFSNAPTPRDK